MDYNDINCLPSFYLYLESIMSEVDIAKRAAHRIYKKFNPQGAPLGSYEISSLLKSIYEYMKIPFNPKQSDIEGYKKSLDTNKDGHVTLPDIEALAIDCLCGKGYSITQETTLKAKNFPKDINSSGYNYPLKSVAQPFQTILANPSQKLINSYSNQNKNQQIGIGFAGEKWGAHEYSAEHFQAGKYQVPKDSFSMKYQDQYHIETNNTFQTNDEHIGGFGMKFDGNYTYTNPAQSLNDFGVNTSYSYGDSNTGNFYKIGQQSQKINNNSQYSVRFESGYTNKIGQRQYSEEVKQILKLISQIFRPYADSVTFTVSEKQVPNLLTDTYNILGRDDYYPSNQDVKEWMNLCDPNRDGKVQYQDYQYFVVKSLQRSGMNLYD